jgi:hypothetical protein
MSINVLAEEIDQIFSDQQKHDHTMKMISNSENSLSFQSFSKDESNVVNVESSLNFTDFELSLKIIDEQVSESQDIDDTSTVDEELSNQNDHAQELSINFENLTSNTQQRLLNMTVKKIQSSVREDDVIVNYREQNYHTEYTIKYLHSISRFIIKDAISSFYAQKSFIKSLKSIFNSTLIRTYVKIVRDHKKNKKWRSEVRMIAEKSCYQLVLDKKAIEDVLNSDFNSKLNNSSYHFIDSYESRIAERHIWFIQSMIISNDRKQTAALCARNHYEWKKNAIQIYAEQCKKYVENRIKWEWDLINVIIDTSELKWSSRAFFERILRLINSKRIHLFENVRRIVEEENDVK